MKVKVSSGLLCGAVPLFILSVIISQLFIFSTRFDLQVFRISTLDQSAAPFLQAALPKIKKRPLTALELRFQQGVVMLHTQRYEYALVAFNQVIKLSPKMPEAFVNMGYALLGLERYQEAESYFDKATALRPYQGNAYWGLAISLEKQGDLQGAMGAMRTYIHLAAAGDGYVKKARSALWEWGELLKKGKRSEQEQAWLDKRSQEWKNRDQPVKDEFKPESLTLPVK